MSDLAHNVEVRRNDQHWELLINGEPFPWHVSEDGVQLTVTAGSCPAITLTILCDNITVTDNLGWTG